IAVRFRIFLVDRDCPERCFLCFRVSIERLDINAAQKIPNLRDSGPGAGKFRILIKRALKKAERASKIVLACPVREVEALEIKIVNFGITLLVNGKFAGKLDLERVYDRSRNFILQRKDA